MFVRVCQRQLLRVVPRREIERVTHLVVQGGEASGDTYIDGAENKFWLVERIGNAWRAVCWMEPRSASVI